MASSYIVASDPLGHQAETWAGRTAGPLCFSCKGRITNGHRYYKQHRKQREIFIHYCCLGYKLNRSTK